MEQPNAGEIREPMETGTIPDQTEGSYEQFKQNTDE